MSFANSTKVALDLRGARLSLEREALMELPESVLLCLFPNGVVLSPQRQPQGEGEEEDEEADVYYVDVSGQIQPVAAPRRRLSPTHRGDVQRRASRARP